MTQPRRRLWTAQEDEVLRTYYMPSPRGARWVAVHARLPSRTKHAVVSRARYLGLTGKQRTVK